MPHKFNPAHAERLLSDDRLKWNDPEQILQQLNLGQCTAMADIGCGPGFFTLPAARKIQPGGVVYGVDIREEMLAMLKERAQAAGLANVQPVLAEEDDEYPLPSLSVDVALICNMYHEVDSASNFLGELKRILRPEATCLVVDWRKEPTPMGPPVDQRVDQQDVTEEFASAGFVPAGTCDVGPYHYGLRFFKPKGVQE